MVGIRYLGIDLAIIFIPEVNSPMSFKVKEYQLSSVFKFISAKGKNTVYGYHFV